MIKINPKCLGVYHRLTANKNLKDWKKGDWRDVLIAQFKDGRFAVMGIFVVNLYDASLCKMDFFYQLFKDEQELHDTFTEQFTMLTGFTKSEA